MESTFGKFSNLSLALAHFDGNSGLSNGQAIAFLNKSYENGRVNKHDLELEFSSALRDSNFKWKDFLNNIQLINYQSNSSERKLKNNVLEIFNKLIYKDYKDRLKIEFRFGDVESPIWSKEEHLAIKSDYNIQLDKLKLNHGTLTRIKTSIKLYRRRKNPISEKLPSFWSGRMEVSFKTLINLIYYEILEQIITEYELSNFETAIMNNDIDIEEIDDKLSLLISNPSNYCDTNGIPYESKIVLEKNIKEAYAAWRIEELTYITI